MSHFKLKRKGEGDGGPKPDLTSLLATGNQITSECAILTNLPPITFFPNKLVTHMINTQIVQKDLTNKCKALPLSHLFTSGSTHHWHPCSTISILHSFNG